MTPLAEGTTPCTAKPRRGSLPPSPKLPLSAAPPFRDDTTLQDARYTDLTDAPRTQGRPNLKGVLDNVVFCNHAQPEKNDAAIGDKRDLGSKSSKQNEFELEMVWKIVHYLLQQGHELKDMVILTPYLGQLQMLKASLQREYNAVLNDLDSWELVRAGVVSGNNNAGSGARGQNKARELHLATIGEGFRPFLWRELRLTWNSRR